MHDALAVRRLQRAGNLRPSSITSAGGRGPFASLVASVLDELHHEVTYAVIQLADIEDLADVRVTQRCQSFRLPEGTLIKPVVSDFDGDCSV